MHNRRKHYRIFYPMTERPGFAFESTISEVIELSERGLRFRADEAKPPLHSRVAGRVALRQGVELEVSGIVVRKTENSVALHLDLQPIPFMAVIREQLYLRKLGTMAV
jgi:PilZ domain